MNNNLTIEEFKITSKIEQMLVRIAESNYASINEMNLFFTSNGHVYKVLSGLLGMNVIAEIKTGISPHKVYYLTSVGYEFLERKGTLVNLGRFQSSDFRITTCTHHLTGLGTRILLEKILDARNWKTEKRLNYARTEDGIDGRRMIKRVTDAEFDIGEIHVGVEVELTLKSPSILRKNFDSLNDRIRRNNLNNIFWITRNEGVRDAVRRICGIDPEQTLFKLSDVNASHLFIDYRELAEKKGDALVTDLAGKIKMLKDLVC